MRLNRGMPLRSPAHTQSKESQGDSGNAKVRSFGSRLKKVRKTITKLKIKRRKGKQSPPSSSADPEHLDIYTQQSQSLENKSNPSNGKTLETQTSSQSRLAVSYLEQPAQPGDTAASQKVQGTEANSSKDNAQQLQASSKEAEKPTTRTQVPSPIRNKVVTSKYSVIANTARGNKRSAVKDSIMEDSIVGKMYDSIPLLEATKLPRGGISIETEAVGRVQVRLHSINRTVALRLSFYPLVSIY